MKRRLLMWMSVGAWLLMLGMLGCSSQPGSDEPQTETGMIEVVTGVVEVEKLVTQVVVTKEVTKVATPPASEEITVRLWAADDFEEQAIRAMVERFRKLHPEITVHLIVVTPEGVR